jgi:protein-tyrosine phosphatase
MIDLHTHILPGLDHGPSGWEESLNMARIASEDGIVALAATPHVNFQFRSDGERIRSAAAEFRKKLSGAGIELEILVGGDYHLTPELLGDLDGILTLGENGRYFLLEFPEMVIPPNSLNILKRFLERGLTPVITHPERNHHLIRQQGQLREMIEVGCVVQITAGSLTGLFGEEVMKASASFLGKGLGHILASDAHWETERPPVLSEGLEAAAGILGEEAALTMVRDNPGRILGGEDVLAVTAAGEDGTGGRHRV